MVPLSTGVKLDEAWPLMPAGSSVSMSNFVPMNGKIVPRSRLSSLNTIRTLGSIVGLQPLYTAAGFGVGQIWASHSTIHGLLYSTGSISKASFVSAFGLGVAGLPTMGNWQYITTFSSTLNENMVVATGNPTGVGSYTTLQCLYQTGGSLSGAPLYSYLTSAPQAKCVGSFDNYILAWNCKDGGSVQLTRLRWNQRGSPSNWTGEGSGFEDLLEMKGQGTRVMGTADQRILIFTDLETWYGVGATYPAQFQFAPLDRNVGCMASLTAVETDVGVIFLGSDQALRVIPKGGGPSQVVSAPISEHLQNTNDFLTDNYSYGVYDPYQKLYYLMLDPSVSATTHKGFVLNVVSGEWGFMDYNAPASRCATALQGIGSGTIDGKVYFGNSTGTAYSLNSSTSLENGSAVTSTWRSAPIAADLPGSYKQLTKVCLDYRATSKSTVTLKISQDGGNNYETTGVAMSLISAPVSGRVEQDVYNGGAFPAIELTSTSTGYELHRLDVSMNLGGRK